MPDFGTPFQGLGIGRKMTKEELIRAVRFAIAAEFEAVQLYTQIADASDDPEVSIVMRDVANEELVHSGEFMALVKKLNPDEEKLWKDGEKETNNINKKSYIIISKEIRNIAKKINKVN
jgi:rubrerythrin